MIVRNRTWPIGQSPDERVRQRTLPVAGGDGATVSFDFVGMGGVLDSRWTFSRAAGSGFLAGTGPTYIGADGLVKYATTNQPRFDYDPTTLAPRGLLIEGSSNNLVFRSQSLNTSPWNRPAAVSVSETGSGSPANDNTSNVVTWTNSTGVGSAWLEQSITVSGSQPYTWSVWLKQRNNQRVSVFGLAKNSGGSIVGNIETTVNFSVSPPTVTNTVTSGYTSVTTPTLTEYPNGWYRMVATGTTPATAATTSFGISNKDAVPATGTNGCEVWGAQLEAGSGASSYIPTGSAAGTREQDTASFADAAAIGFDRRKGTLYFSGTQFKHASSFARSVRLAAAPGGSEPMGIAVNGSTFYGTARDASFVAFGDAIRTNTLLQPFAFAVAFNADTPSSVLRGSLNGSSVSVTQSSAAAPPTAAAVSMDLNSGSSATAYASMAIRSVKFWPTDKSLSELTSITS